MRSAVPKSRPGDVSPVDAVCQMEGRGIVFRVTGNRLNIASKNSSWAWPRRQNSGKRTRPVGRPDPDSDHPKLRYHVGFEHVLFAADENPPDTIADEHPHRLCRLVYHEVRKTSPFIDERGVPWGGGSNSRGRPAPWLFAATLYRASSRSLASPCGWRRRRCAGTGQPKRSARCQNRAAAGRSSSKPAWRYTCRDAYSAHFPGHCINERKEVVADRAAAELPGIHVPSRLQQCLAAVALAEIHIVVRNNRKIVAYGLPTLRRIPFLCRRNLCAIWATSWINCGFV